MVQENTTNCSDIEQNDIIITGVAINGLSTIMALIPSILIFVLKLHRQFTYRVAFYQVRGCILYQFAEVLSFLAPLLIGKHRYTQSCELAAFFLTFFFLLKLFLVSFIVIHLFIFAIIYRSVKRFELLYIIFSVVASALAAAVPFTTKTYGLAGAWCWIKNRQDDCTAQVLKKGVIEQFALYYGPGLVILAIDSVVIITMVLILSLRLRRIKRGYCNIDANNSTAQVHPLEKALKQIIPLVAYPVAFFLLVLPGFANRVYGAMPGQLSIGLTYLVAVSVSIWGCVGGTTLSIHIGMLLLSQRRKHKKLTISDDATENNHTVDVSSDRATSTSRTHFVLPKESSILQ